jgi:hypothetical protein
MRIRLLSGGPVSSHARDQATSFDDMSSSDCDATCYPSDAGLSAGWEPMVELADLGRAQFGW